MLKKRVAFLAATLCCLLSSSIASADMAIDRVRDGIKRYTAGQVEVTRIAHTPIPGIFEVVSGVDVFYSDATGRYAFVDGRLVDTEKKMDLTQATLATLTTVDFKALPLDLAIKTVTGTGDLPEATRLTGATEGRDAVYLPLPDHLGEVDPGRYRGPLRAG